MEYKSSLRNRKTCCFFTILAEKNCFAQVNTGMTIFYKKTDEWYIEWQRMTSNDNEWYNEWYNKWQSLLQSKWCQGPLKTLYINSVFYACYNHHILQTELFDSGFWNYIDLVLCINGYHLKDMKLYVLDPFPLANKLSKV